jgi:hypothetical protein
VWELHRRLGALFADFTLSLLNALHDRARALVSAAAVFALSASTVVAAVCFAQVAAAFGLPFGAGLSVSIVPNTNAGVAVIESAESAQRTFAAVGAGCFTDCTAATYRFGERRCLALAHVFRHVSQRTVDTEAVLPLSATKFIS